MIKTFIYKINKYFEGQMMWNAKMSEHLKPRIIQSPDRADKSLFGTLHQYANHELIPSEKEGAERE